jgi:hypothetical protein
VPRKKLFLSTLIFFVLLGLPIINSVGASSVMWSQTYGGGARDSAEKIVQTSDGGYAVAGWTVSLVDNVDCWLIKTDPFGNMVWNQTYGEGGEYAFSLVETFDGGFALAGTTMHGGGGNYDFWLVKTDGAGNILWNQTYGGTKIDQAHAIVQTGDGGFALAGYTQSFGGGTQSSWLIKTDSFGNMEWNRTYGEEGMVYASSLVSTSDGGFALAGETFSEDRLFDFSLVKTDEDGNLQWTQTYGGEQWDRASSLVSTSDGGFALVGRTISFGEGSYDCWLVKTDMNGNMQWNNTYGGPEWDEAFSLVETSDGGFALAGDTKSFGAGEYDFWLVKTDGFGNMVWNQMYGGSGNDHAFSLVETSDGEFVLAGRTNSFGAGEYDVWLVKTDASGKMEWSRTYGGAGNDYAFSLVETSDGGYALAGSTRSFGAEHTDGLLIKTDGSGEEEWNRTFGQTGNNRVLRSLVETSDGGFVLAGSIYTFDTSDRDVWLVKTDGLGNLEWNRTYGGPRFDSAYSLVVTSDGGFALAGETSSYGFGNFDVWLIKTDASGTMEWTRNYGGEVDDRAYSLIEVSDGGFALAGETESYAVGGDDVWFIRTNEQGIPEFPSWAPMLLTLIALTVFLAVYRKRLPKTPNNQSY